MLASIKISTTFGLTEFDKTVVKVLPQVMRNFNELNIPSGQRHGFEIMYFGVNLKLMCDYRLSFDIELISSSISDKIEVVIVSRKYVPTWKDSYLSDNNNNSNNNNRDNQTPALHYINRGRKINDVFRPTASDAYAFILSNRTSVNDHEESKTKVVRVILTHSWIQKIKESHLKNRT
ncbi:MAG: hypothetical protein ICV56_02210 [Nitrososphaeraceae archaeon]|nr:hypothetical protein [Nitrososphaeraceae archaeon]